MKKAAKQTKGKKNLSKSQVKKMFAEKLEKANELLTKVGVPKLVKQS